MVTEGKYTDIIGKKVHVIVDRPAGSYHPRNHGDSHHRTDGDRHHRHHGADSER